MARAGWIESDAAEWEVEASLFPTLLKSEKRWMSWEIFPAHKITYSPMDECPELWRAFVDYPKERTPTFGSLTGMVH